MYGIPPCIFWQAVKPFNKRSFLALRQGFVYVRACDFIAIETSMRVASGDVQNWCCLCRAFYDNMWFWWMVAERDAAYVAHFMVIYEPSRRLVDIIEVKISERECLVITRMSWQPLPLLEKCHIFCKLDLEKFVLMSYTLSRFFVLPFWFNLCLCLCR